MAEVIATINSSVNPQVTDAVTQANVDVVGQAPAMSMGSVYQSMGQSLSILYANSVAAQQNQSTLQQAATNQGVMQIYALDTAVAAGAAEKAGQLGVSDNLSSLLTVLKAFK